MYHTLSHPSTGRISYRAGPRDGTGIYPSQLTNQAKSGGEKVKLSFDVEPPSHGKNPARDNSISEKGAER